MFGTLPPHCCALAEQPQAGCAPTHDQPRPHVELGNLLARGALPLLQPLLLLADVLGAHRAGRLVEQDGVQAQRGSVSGMLEGSETLGSPAAASDRGAATGSSASPCPHLLCLLHLLQVLGQVGPERLEGRRAPHEEPLQAGARGSRAVSAQWRQRRRGGATRAIAFVGGLNSFLTSFKCN